MAFRARYFLIGFGALIVAAGLIGWHFFGGQRDVLKPDGGPVVTVMDFGQSFPLDPLPSGWRHRKFWTRSPMSMAFAVKDGVPSMRFETHDSASMLFRHVDIDLAAYPMLAWRWYIELPISSPLDERTREGDDHPARLFLRFATDRGEKRAMEVIWGQSAEPGRLQVHRRVSTLRCRRRRRPGWPLARRKDRPRPRLCRDLEGCGAGAPSRYRGVLRQRRYAHRQHQLFRLRPARTAVTLGQVVAVNTSRRPRS
ncbi:MAG TPA: DUF3047 domain-containing protein [Tepidisphaeraceae bacterium]|nr:DUF3047 domain-containing protein [Tepidisphaeraceae bacterium]